MALVRPTFRAFVSELRSPRLVARTSYAASFQGLFFLIDRLKLSSPPLGFPLSASNLLASFSPALRTTVPLGSSTLPYQTERLFYTNSVQFGSDTDATSLPSPSDAGIKRRPRGPTVKHVSVELTSYLNALLGEDVARKACAAIHKADLEQDALVRKRVESLQRLMGPDMFQKVVETNPRILACNASDVTDSFDRLVQNLGKELAYKALGLRSTILSKITASEGCTLSVISDVFGDAAFGIITRNPGLLRLDAHLLRENALATLRHFGEEDAKTIVIRQPSVLYVENERQEQVIATLADHLRDREGAVRIIVRNPKLLCQVNSTSLSGVLGHLEELFGNNMITFVLNHPTVLMAHFEKIPALVALVTERLGREEAALIISKNLGLLRCKMSTVTKSWQALDLMFGTDVADTLVRRNPSILVGRPANFRSTFNTVLELLGEVKGQEVVHRQPGLLKTDHMAMKETWGILVAAVGERAVLEMAIRNPLMLTFKPATVQQALLALEELVGTEGAKEKITRQIEVLACKEATLIEAVPTLTEILGSEEVPPVTLRLPELVYSVTLVSERS
ncbi:hypothetical protein CYMTET_23745 [Cymbomonas tetramitiformis]|uniref:Uncharacterized protein n=1 Tax=Cymbomonas tetramitiformis TaxID=36881 RepID=A0AAE0FYN7_9CHLO|nr:hypothetical protein CYMTET_23745 [Cymbomonas tetramitiformis]